MAFLLGNRKTKFANDNNKEALRLASGLKLYLFFP